MRNPPYLWAAVVLCLLLIAVLFYRLSNLDSRIGNASAQTSGGTADLQNTIKRMQADLANAKELTPGLGEYMTTIQLHAGKLWFAAKASNWELAEYELDELKETMEAAKRLNLEKNGIKISGVLDSVLQTQVAELDKSIKSKSPADFQKSYDGTLYACNGCHTETGYKFMQIVRPSAPPVTNQKW